MRNNRPFLLHALLIASLARAGAWTQIKPGTTQCHQTSFNRNLFARAAHPPSANDDHGHQDTSNTNSWNRREWLSRALVTSTLAVASVAQQPAWALVKGNAPPSSMKVPSSERKCKNIDECAALAEKAEAERAAEAAAVAADAQVTGTGIRYRDEEVGTGAEAKLGDDVEIYFKVLKLGKRSFDGLSGEGTVVFSRGYGLEDDEKNPGDKSFLTTLGSLGNIVALNEAIPGMKEGGIRRFAILPEKGWRKPGRQCDGGPGGLGAGGDVRTDYVVVPTAQLVAEEACFDQSKQPFPFTYGQQRRMAQRFDQSLIMEVQLVETGRGLLGF